MKKVLMIGKLNETLSDINIALSECFKVQLCPEDASGLDGMISIFKPDLIIVSLIGGDVGADLFDKLSNEYSSIPVITVGSEIESWMFSSYYYSSDQFQQVNRPISRQQILEIVCSKLGVNPMAERAKVVEDNVDRRPVRQDNKLKVLVVDDDPMMLRSVKSVLDGRYQVSIATSGVKAISTIAKNRPDVILLDYEMPICDGKQTLEMIRSDDDIKDIPVVFLTGVSDKAHIYAVLSLRPAGYIVKPADTKKLIETIEKAAASIV